MHAPSRRPYNHRRSCMARSVARCPDFSKYHPCTGVVKRQMQFGSVCWASLWNWRHVLMFILSTTHTRNDRRLSFVTTLDVRGDSKYSEMVYGCKRCATTWPSGTIFPWKLSLFSYTHVQTGVNDVNKKFVQF